MTINYDAIRAYHVSDNGHIEFQGHNCDGEWGECNGWDGISKRCQCDNRRVTWECRKSPETNNPEDWYAAVY